MKRTYHCLLILTCLCSPLVAGQRASSKPKDAASRTNTVSKPVKNDSVVQEPEPQARVVRYSDKDIIQVRAKLRQTTLLVLPRSEEILDFVCGDKEYWIVNGTQNLAYVKPAKAGAHTTLHLITASGNIFSFTLSEVS